MNQYNINEIDDYQQQNQKFINKNEQLIIL